MLRSSATLLADCHPRGNILHYVQRKYWDISPECNSRKAESHKLELLLPASRLFLWKRKSEKKKETRETGELGTSQQRSSPPTEKYKLFTEYALKSSKLFSCFTLWSYIFKMILCPNLPFLYSVQRAQFVLLTCFFMPCTRMSERNGIWVNPSSYHIELL